MFINVLNKETCQNQDLFLSYLFFCLVRYVPVFPSQNFQCRLKKGVRYNLSAIKSFPKKSINYWEVPSGQDVRYMDVSL